MEEKEQKKEEQQEFDFIKEKIKDKPINKRRLLMRAGYDLACAAAFGAVACFVFVFLKPHVEEWLYPEENSAITIPKDDAPQDESGDGEGDEEAGEGKDSPDETEAEEGKDSPQGGEAVEGKDSPDGPQDEDRTGGDPQTVIVQEELEIEDYQALQDKLYAVGRKANQSMVTVTGVTSGMDWFNTPYERENQAVGVIIGNNGQEFLIMTEKSVIADAQAIEVTFSDDASVEATLKKYDGNTGIAVLGVPLRNVSEKTMGQAAVASLGNSYLVSQGTAVIALGIPSEHTILCGTVTSSQNAVSTVDANYSVLTTDIAGGGSGSGVLVNLEGEIVGLALSGYGSQSGRNTVTALSVSELKQVIEDLSNDRDVPCVGLYISTVTDKIAEEYGIPKGVYVKDVEMDSPALAAGLQEADVITAINGEEITSVEQYSQKVYGLHPGDVITITVKRQRGEEYVDLDCAVTVGVLE